MEWQPIETAPKDGEIVVLWDGDAAVGYFGANDEWMIDLDRAVVPTHWMPLPEAPNA